VGRYSADFAYTDRRTGQLVVEDVKGGEATKTQAYQLRKKLLLACHGLQVTEV
jgi:very-short-patch-repair endonuclease